MERKKESEKINEIISKLKEKFTDKGDMEIVQSIDKKLKSKVILK
tara:strand:- start:3032 stop:3166 length:135 start_codon:yes stop_codon:yes gene_type:complete